MTPYVAQVSPAARRAVFRDLIRKNKHLPGYAVCSFVSIAKLSAGRRPARARPARRRRRLFCVFSVASVASESNHPSRTFGNSVMRMFVHP